MEAYHETEFGKLYLGDCLDVMRQFPYKSFDLCLTDPPYGIRMSKGFVGFGGFGGFGKPIHRKKYDDDWDSERPNKDVFDVIISKSILSMIFGGNYFADILPVSTHWIVWDKINTMPTFSDCELVWTNSKRKSVMKYTFEYNGLIGKEQKRFHPTQKPIGLIAKIIHDYSKENDTIFDPFAGSGTTAIACIRQGRKYVMIEREEKYCEIAAKRVDTELDQLTLL